MLAAREDTNISRRCSSSGTLRQLPSALFPSGERTRLSRRACVGPDSRHAANFVGEDVAAKTNFVSFCVLLSSTLCPGTNVIFLSLFTLTALL